MSNPNEEARKEEEKKESRFSGEPPFDKHPGGAEFAHTGGDAVKVSVKSTDQEDHSEERASVEAHLKAEALRGAPVPDIATAKTIFGEMVAAGCKVEGGGLFDNRGYIVSLEMTTVRIGTDGFIELHPRGLPAVRVPLRVNDLLALTKVIVSLRDQGKIG